MASGTYEERLRVSLDPARRWQVLVAQEQWRTGADKLRAVADAVAEARPLAHANLGNHTADAADGAFVAMHDKVLAREQQMRDGSVALQAAIEAIGRAEAVRNGFDAEGPLTEPPPPDWDEDEIRQIQQVKAHHAQMSAYHGQVAAREEAARAAIQDLDSTNRSSAVTMRRIQGDRPDVLAGGTGTPPSSGRGGSGSGGGVRPTSPSDPPRLPPVDVGDPSEPADPSPSGGTVTPQGSGDGSTSPVGASDSAVSAASTGADDAAGSQGGIAGAVGAGLAGGAMGMGGAIRGGGAGVNASRATGAGRAIGSSPRTGSSAALGRAPGAASAPDRGPATRGAAGRGQTGSRAGGRGAGRGAAGVAGGRGGQKKHDDTSSRGEAIVDDQDWVDDEDAAPGVIS